VSLPHDGVSPKISVEFDWAGAADAAGDGDGGDEFSREKLQGVMWEAAGVLRSGDSLAAASVTLAGWARPGTGTDAPVRSHEDANLLDLARITVEAALAREESRGAHHRADFSVARPELAHPLVWTRADERIEAKEAIAC
jgi:L-aspartate oxidase